MENLMTQTSNVADDSSSALDTQSGTLLDTKASTTSVQSQPQQQQQQQPVVSSLSMTTTTAAAAAAAAAVTATNASGATVGQNRDLSTYVAIYNHAVHCTVPPSACGVARCAQLRRLIAHSRTCLKIRRNECDYCRQLIALTIVHARTCVDVSCVTPYCAAVKRRLDEANEIRARVESAYDFVHNSMQFISKQTQLSRQVDADWDAEPDPGERVDHDDNDDEQKQKILAEIERVKSLDETSPGTLKKADLKFGKELAKYVFKKLVHETSHFDQIDAYKTDIKFARLARTFIALNLGLIKRVASVNLDDYLYLFVDLAQRFHSVLARCAKKSVECQTDNQEVVVKKRSSDDIYDQDGDDDPPNNCSSNAKRIRAV